jgi:hypothetical protein
MPTHRNRAQMKVRKNCLDCIVYCVCIVVTSLFKWKGTEWARMSMTTSVRDCESTENLDDTKPLTHFVETLQSSFTGVLCELPWSRCRRVLATADLTLPCLHSL